MNHRISYNRVILIGLLALIPCFGVTEPKPATVEQVSTYAGDQHVQAGDTLPARMQRSIGVVYHGEDEQAKHYYPASLPRQFDEYIWFDQTQALKPIYQEE